MDSSPPNPNPIGSHHGPILPSIGGILNPSHPNHGSPSSLPPPFTSTPTTIPNSIPIPGFNSNADVEQQAALRHSQPNDPSPPAGNTPLQPFQRQQGGEGMAAPQKEAQARVTSTKPAPPPLDSMRAYRACLNCRSRKSKCDLEINQGRPPCRRCQREARECVLGESHRGGRRVRKKPKLDDNPDAPTTPVQPGFPQSSDTSSQYSPRINHSPSHPHSFQPPFESQTDSTGQRYSWGGHAPTSATASDVARSSSLNGVPTLNNSLADYSLRKSSVASTSMKAGEAVVHDNIASADLQNPSDALEILAQVADRAEDGDSSGDQIQIQTQRPPKHSRQSSSRHGPGLTNQDDHFYYKPVQDGSISTEMIYTLFSTYQEFFHPFFPIAPQQSFDRARLPWMSRAEPHLFAAILTVASKDNERVHHICYDHMQQLVSMILAGADADIEAVEALLLLSQWVSHRPQASVAVGRGEEDRVAWMYIGTALRLGYFLGIDRSSFKPDSREDPATFNRKRLVWVACYICDRQVSVRVGKGFWSRGPGPLTGLRGKDFPALNTQSQEGENWGLIFQANLEIIQIFSNVHDILYSSKGHGWVEMLEGRYAKYLDDFRTSIRNWNDVWGTLVCSPRLKASMLLTYDYLRLYVNAFAYQATISRALTFQRDSQHTQKRQTMPLINATAPDARFIYEALDAAKSLLSTFNNFVEPETLRYMPSSYYLFIIYSAVFLYKARSTTTMTEEERTGVRRMINQTIERLQKAAVGGANHMGSRYARLLQLLWRKAPKPSKTSSTNVQNRNNPPTSISERINPQQDSPHAQAQNSTQNSTSPISSYHQQPQQNQGYNQSNPQFQNLNVHSRMNLSSPQNMSHQHPYGQPNTNSNNGTSTFSWLDLGATWNFATQNNSGSNAGSGGEMDMDDDHALWDNGMSPFDMGLLTDYSVLEGDNPNLIF